MIRRILINGVLNLAVLAACIAAVIAVVWVVNSLLNVAWPNPTMPDRLIVSLTLPFAVVLFALLLEKSCRVVGGSETTSNVSTVQVV